MAGAIATVQAALEGVVDGEGTRVVTRTFTPGEHPEMGLGGPAGADVYWGTAPGYRAGAGLRDEGAIMAARLTAGHGFPPDEPDMFAVFCGVGPGLAPRTRVGPVRTTVVAPALEEYTGIPTPADAVGVSVLPQMRGHR